jgi:hypothetical protein
MEVKIGKPDPLLAKAEELLHIAADYGDNVYGRTSYDTALNAILEALRDVREKAYEESAQIADAHLEYLYLHGGEVRGCGCGKQIGLHIREAGNVE